MTHPKHLTDSPAVQRLLQALEEAIAAAEEVDAQMGWVLPADIPLQPGETRGTGWAETLGNLAEQLRHEVQPPRRRAEVEGTVTEGTKDKR